MHQFHKRAPRRTSRMVIAALITGLSVAAVAEQVVVKKAVRVKSDTNAFAELVEKVPADTSLEVLSNKDGWLRVRTPSGKEGFIAAGDLPPSSSIASVSGSGQTNGVATDAALRGGFEDNAKAYAASKNYSKEGVQQMMALGDSITDDDVVDFGTAGHVGPKKFRH